MSWIGAAPSTTWLGLGAFVGWLLVVVLAATLRSKAYAAARGILLGVHTLVLWGLWAHVGRFWPVFLYLHLAVLLRSAMLVRPRMRPLWYLVFVSWPDAFFQAGTLLCFPFAIAFALGFDPPGFWITYLLAAIGMVQSWRGRPMEQVDLVVAEGTSIVGPARAPLGDMRVDRPLRIAQITDPHLGAFMPVERLHRICLRLVEADPDLVMLTGDFLTMESQGDRALLARALAPLRALEGKVFACFGNHDLEAPETVRSALAEVGATLLVDESTVVETAAGRVQVVGANFRWRERSDHLTELCRAHPREPGALRVVLLHDPGAFKALPEGEGDLVLSGHTHGGQIGFVSLGLPYTLMRLFTSSPDHGFWGRGTDRLYVHRGTGHYGFPVRLGVPAEESVLAIHAPSAIG